MKPIPYIRTVLPLVEKRNDVLNFPNGQRPYILKRHGLTKSYKGLILISENAWAPFENILKNRNKILNNLLYVIVFLIKSISQKKSIK